MTSTILFARRKTWITKIKAVNTRRWWSVVATVAASPKLHGCPFGVLSGGGNLV